MSFSNPLIPTVDPPDTSTVGINGFEKDKKFALCQNYPNPFSTSTSIKYSLKEPCQVYLSIYNLDGQEIKTLVNKYQAAGEHEINWQAKGLSGGFYFYRMQAGEFFETRKLILQK